MNKNNEVIKDLKETFICNHAAIKVDIHKKFTFIRIGNYVKVFTIEAFCNFEKDCNNNKSFNCLSHEKIFFF